MAQQREGREWLILADEFESESEFREAVQDELARLENMGFRLGRAFVVTPLRESREIGNTVVYDTIGWAFSETFMPAVRKQEPEPEVPVEEPELEPVGAGA